MSDIEREGQARASDAMAAESDETTSVAVPERVFVGTRLFRGLIFGVALATVVVILAAQNTGSVTLSLRGRDLSTPVIVLILAALLIGVVLDELFGLVYRKRRRRTLRKSGRVAAPAMTRRPLIAAATPIRDTEGRDDPWPI